MVSRRYIRIFQYINFQIFIKSKSNFKPETSVKLREFDVRKSESASSVGTPTFCFYTRMTY
ncbi:hypothetical protein BWD12_18015 [Leptospira santarosai serovar Bananal]|uniref:Uncharacterized protein n=1 Tax=Leptospira santarosai TaxID=28183 RepID=A0AB73M5P3_9LEPT|nr:hypothetical protein BV917_10945 [Leptospira santarosai serovar Guaricura]OLY63986.1 hypothetical protein BWD11_11690 [Leptospira santarosai serovar Grippotyphosa]ONF76639.1 hypothetical protein BWD12_18015 [Leptospira santarosai serovar Bananal]ONF91629.1 hypothetical protein BWD14_16415 [Leptospira santarosai]